MTEIRSGTVTHKKGGGAGKPCNNRGGKPYKKGPNLTKMRGGGQTFSYKKGGRPYKNEGELYRKEEGANLIKKRGDLTKKREDLTKKRGDKPFQKSGTNRTKKREV